MRIIFQKWLIYEYFALIENKFENNVAVKFSCNAVAEVFGRWKWKNNFQDFVFDN